MRHAYFKVLAVECMLCCSVAVAQLAQAQQPPGDGLPQKVRIKRSPREEDWTQHFRIGGQVGLKIKASFSVNGQFNLFPGDVGPTGVHGADHFYDDGYVRVDMSGNPEGYTSFWGYDNPSQFDAANHRLLMHSASGYSANDTTTQNDTPPFVGFEMAYGGYLWRAHDARIGWELGFGLLPISITDRQPMAARVAQSVYSFDTTGITSLPPAPYRGNVDTIGNATPHDVATLVGATTGAAGTITGRRTLDTMLYTIRLGPSVYWDIHRHVGMSLGAGPAVGIVSGELEYDEEVIVPGSSANIRGEISETDVVYGGYVNAAVMVHLVENGDIYLGAQYMPLSAAKIGGGGREAQLNFKGQVYVFAGINWPF